MSFKDWIYIDDSKYSEYSWDEMLGVIRNENKDKETPEFDKKVWKTRIWYSKKVLDIFENSGGKSNEELLSELRNFVETLVTSLTIKEKSALKKIEEYSLLIKEQKLKWDMEEDEIEINDEYHRRNQQELENVSNMESQILKLKQTSGKLELLIHLQDKLSEFEHKTAIVDEFKNNGAERLKIPKVIEHIIHNIRHKILYSNFWIHFLIREKDWPIEPKEINGRYFRNTPFTITKWRGEKESIRNTLKHEWRHNIFNSLIKQRKVSIAEHVKSLDFAFQKYEKLMKLKAPKILLSEIKKRIITKISTIANIHINENRDEILANFENLAKGKWSSDIRKYHRDREVLQELRKKYKDTWKPLELIDMAIQIYEDEMKHFYQKMSEYLFIASHTGNLEKIRLIIYWIEMVNYKTIEDYLRSDIGEETYNAIAAMRNLVNPLGIEKLVTGEKIQKTLKPDEILLRAIFGDDDTHKENRFFKQALLPENIASLKLYLKRYRTLDKNKQFRENMYLKEFIRSVLNPKLRFLQSKNQWMTLPSDDPTRIKEEKYLQDLIELQRLLLRYTQEVKI
jgi:hypothetical protein